MTPEDAAASIEEKTGETRRLLGDAVWWDVERSVVMAPGYPAVKSQVMAPTRDVCAIDEDLAEIISLALGGEDAFREDDEWT